MDDRMARGSQWIAIAALVTLASLAACSEPPSTGGEKKDPAAAAAPAASAPAEKAAAAAPAEKPAPAAGAAAQAAPGGDKAKIGELIKRHFTSSGQIPEDVEFAVTKLEPSPIAGLSEGTVKLSRGEQSQELAFLISADGRWFLRVDPVDLTIDPVQMVLGKIKAGPENPSLGPKDAAVTIVEYSDFQCPFCARAETIVQEEVLKAYGDKVRFVYKQFPLSQIHPWAEPASLLGLCLYQQAGNDAYWKYHSAVFAKQKEIEGEEAEDRLMKIAQEAGGDKAKLEECVEKQEVAKILEATVEEAEAIGVNSTPTFFVNGHRLSGAQPLDAFKGVIEPELRKAGKS